MSSDTLYRLFDTADETTIRCIESVFVSNSFIRVGGLRLTEKCICWTKHVLRLTAKFICWTKHVLRLTEKFICWTKHGNRGMSSRYYLPLVPYYRRNDDTRHRKGGGLPSTHTFIGVILTYKSIY